MIRRTLVLMAVALPLAACGSAANTSSNAGGAKGDQMLAFARCMRTHGVSNFPDPGGRGMQFQASPNGTTVNGVSVNGPAFQRAMQACRSQLPNGGRPPVMTASQRAQALRFSQCMRTHGVPSFPDPSFSGTGAIRIGGLNVDPNSPAFKAAQAACGSLFGKARPVTATAR
jgi:hypothetical protein